ncbi:MAG: cupin domain-containing protein [Deinococcus sp.]|nr:cupin domain-containing protein [Deinococcus sp.]MCL5965344.1 cupin domain-containing protein [Deinococcus sp.]
MFLQGNLKRLAVENRDFRHVIGTGLYGQLVLMSIPEEEELGEETHPGTDQLMVFASGNGKVVLGGKEVAVETDSAIFVPAGTPYNVINPYHHPLKLYTLYAPPAYPDDLVHSTLAEAFLAEAG